MVMPQGFSNGSSRHIGWVAYMGGPRITDFQVDRCRALWLGGESKSEIARRVGISVTSVSKIVGGLARECPPPSEDGEVWARLSEINERYHVSSHGRVFTDGSGSGAAKVLDVKPSKCVRGRVTLSSYGRPGRYPIDRLVALHFCEGHTEKRDTVVHVDGDLSNNRAENLMWCTRGDDAPHAVRVRPR